jgi:D-3-phosphoglycerate dehydrogenase
MLRPLVIRIGAYPHHATETTAWELDAFTRAGFEYEFHESLTPRARGRLRGASAVITSLVVWDAEKLGLLHECQLMVSCSVGLEAVDVATAERQGISVVNMPALCTDEVADHTLALMLAALRKVPALSEHVHAGRWERDLLEPMERLRALTLGLVGVGRIGRAVAARAAPFGFTVVGYDPYAAESGGIALVDLPTLCRTSDVISLHAPLLAASAGLIGEAELKMMKPSAILVNTSRGRLVDQDALVIALREGRLRCAALDVLEREPPSSGDPVLALDNVILTPHIAGYSDQVVWDIPRLALDVVVQHRQALLAKAAHG